MTDLFDETQRKLYSVICRHDGIKAKDIARITGTERSDINRLLYANPFVHELCCRDDEYLWHGLIRQDRPHAGLEDFCGYYGTADRFTAQSEEEWLAELKKGCRGIGRNLNDTRGLFHSFLDCRNVMRTLFQDLAAMSAGSFQDWEIVFELRINRARMIRIYADVLVIMPGKVFSLEFKMKNSIDPDEVLQAAKYCPFLEVIFGPRFEIFPALVLTSASELFEFVSIGETDMLLPVSSGDMLFNVFNEYLGFLA